jgi:hypothetical protein
MANPGVHGGRGQAFWLAVCTDRGHPPGYKKEGVWKEIVAYNALNIVVLEVTQTRAINMNESRGIPGALEEH